MNDRNDINCPPENEHYECLKWIAENPLEMDWDHYRDVRKAAGNVPDPEAKPLPPILKWSEMMDDLRLNGLPPEIIEGALHKGCKGCISGSSKAGKTWSLVNLAVAAACGMEWLGLQTLESQVLYLDFELHRGFGQLRFKWVREKLNADSEIIEKNLRYWNLRGNREPFATLLAHLELCGIKHQFDLIILDPYYKISTGFDENSASEVAEVMDLVEDFAQATGAAFMFSHHFSKGNKADVESIDRASGSGVFARDPDAILTLTKHSEDDCLTLEATLRNCPPLRDRVLEFSQESFPCFSPRPDLDPDDLKTLGAQRNKADDSKAITLALLPTEAGKELQFGKWRELAAEHGVSPQRFRDRVKEFLEEGIILRRQAPGQGGPTFYSRAEIV